MTPTHAPRGYALIFVLAIGVALGVLVGGLFAILSETVTSGKQAQEELQQLYGCDGAIRLAIHEVRTLGDVDKAKQIERLADLRDALKLDINPRTGRPFADIEQIDVVPADSGIFQSFSDPFFGMQFVQEATEFIVSANPEASRGRLCRAENPTRARTISYFQFAAVSNDVLRGQFDAVPPGKPGNFASDLQVTPDTAGDVYMLQHATSKRSDIGQRRVVTDRGSFTVQDIRIADQETFRPVPPSGQPWSFINKKKKFFGGTKRRTRHKRPQLEYYLKYPTNTPSIDPTFSRFVMQADIRIIDGEWYLDDDRFPGVRVWTDRKGQRDAPGERIYSGYDEVGGEIKGDGKSVIRYGLVDKDGKPHARGYCNNPLELGKVKSSDDVECSSGLNVTAIATKKSPYLAAAELGFIDPHGLGTPILPIVVDVRALATAMTSGGAGELEDHRCLNDNDILCPETRRFQGAIWIGTTPNGILPNGSARAGNTLTPNPLAPKEPCPLQPSGATNCVRPNAVVLTNAGDLDTFFRNGLSIGSNLPMYVVGDFNAEHDPAKVTSKMALMAPVITALPRNFDMVDAAWGKLLPTYGGGGPPLTWRASIFTSWASSDKFKRNPARHILRRISGVSVNVVGSMVAMFRREDYPTIQTFNTGNGSFSSPRSDPMQAGIPTFSPDGDLAEASPGRLVQGTLVYPGEAARDLRRPDVKSQPAAAPRFSIDPAPIDRR